MTFVVHAFMDAAVVRRAWQDLEQGIESDDPDARNAQERLRACSYAMADPDDGRIVPACVQHGVLDQDENRQLLAVAADGARVTDAVDDPTTVAERVAASVASDDPSRSLRAGSVRFVRTVALSVGIQGPAAGVIVGPAILAGIVGGSGALAYLLALVAMSFVAYAFILFSRSFNSASSVYAFNGSTLGARYGFVSAWLLLLVYIAFAGRRLRKHRRHCRCATDLPGRPDLVGVAGARRLGADNAVRVSVLRPLRRGDPHLRRGRRGTDHGRWESSCSPAAAFTITRSRRRHSAPTGSRSPSWGSAW